MMLGRRAAHTGRQGRDRLTGLADRTRLLELLDRPAAGSARGAESTRARAVIVLDIDDFRLVNDTMGLGVGDALLAAVAQRLAQSAPIGSTVARLCADEFAVLVEGAAHVQEAVEVTDRLLRAVSDRPFTVDGHPLAISAGAGVATGFGAIPLGQADLALRAAKQAGKGRSVLYRPALGTAVADRLPMRAELAQAIARGELIVCYQPIVRLPSERVVGFEALLRWVHPTRGVLSPRHFIAVAEDSGLIVPIGAWVMARAIRAAAGWFRSSPARISVSVNVSVRQLAAPGFVDTVLRELAVNGLPPDHLVLELTESMLLPEGSGAWDDVARLRRHGVRIAIDDFGTGCSSLPYLRTGLIDIIKIDKSFVHGVDAAAEQYALVDAIVRLAGAFRLEVVGEGVERQGEGSALYAIGCHYAQGFRYGRPMSDPSEVSGLIQARGERGFTGRASVGRAGGPLAAVSAAA
jgi:diguanylate cyclase (GGDEF)-like protein